MMDLLANILLAKKRTGKQRYGYRPTRVDLLCNKGMAIKEGALNSVKERICR